MKVLTFRALGSTFCCSHRSPNSVKDNDISSHIFEIDMKENMDFGPLDTTELF